MRGFLYHDVQLIRRGLVGWLFLLVGLNLFSVLSSSTLSPLPLVFLYNAISRPLFTHDDKDGWNRYAFSLPEGRKAALRARYLLFSGILAVGTALQIALLPLLSQRFTVDLYDSMLVLVYGTFLLLLFFCLDMTITYYFGLNASAAVSVVFFFLFILAAAPLFQVLLDDLPLAVLQRLLVLILFPVAPAAVYLSYRLSLRAVRTRDF